MFVARRVSAVLAFLLLFSGLSSVNAHNRAAPLQATQHPVADLSEPSGPLVRSSAKTVVFWQDQFPVIGSQPITQSTLKEALGDDTMFLSQAPLKDSGIPTGTELLVMPYGSSFPLDGWPNIHAYLRRGGSLLVIGGQPFRVPVAAENGRYVPGPPQDSYSRELGILHSYEAPQQNGEVFAWRDGYSSFPKLTLRPEKSFVLESRHLDGLAYILDREHTRVSAPVVVMSHTGGLPKEVAGARYVFLDFQSAPAYWDSHDGRALIRTSATYALEGATSFALELEFSTVMPGESPLVSVHLHNALLQREHLALTGSIRLELSSGHALLDSREIPCSAASMDVPVLFTKNLKPGFYRLRGIWLDNQQSRAFYENGFWVEDKSLLFSGPLLAATQDVLTQDGKPFFPVGTNYFSTESNGWDFSGPRNAAIWEDDFAAMEKHNVTFVRTGVWGGQFRFLEGASGGVTERFLRNVEAYLLCAHRHGIAVNFTFFAFDPQTSMRAGESNPVLSLPGSNPYLDPVTIQAEQSYILSIVNRFKNVPYLSWDLINEPSFSNPRALWHGNTPNDDPAELRAWHAWLQKQYGSLERMATAWSIASDQYASFDAVPLPNAHDLSADLEGGTNTMVRAYDYNLFAQDSFAGWVGMMVDAIRANGSHQIIAVGQDEGGVETRVLNQFYSHSGLAFTTNHTYRQNQNLLWDSFASKTPGVANIVGETGYQPVTYPNGDWHFDELTGFSLIESKWAAGFAAGTTGFLPWDWDREIYFGLERSDGSAKTWIATLGAMGDFAHQAEKYATSILQPDVAIVLPQSLQLSVLSRYALEAQQKSFLALYGYNRYAAYAVGEHQLDRLGHPKLIILPSPWTLTSQAWESLLAATRSGATLLVSGGFDLDPHFMPTTRPDQIGLPYVRTLLNTVRNKMTWPGGAATLTYGDHKTDLLQKIFLPSGDTFVEKQLGEGRLLLAALPLELNDNIQAIADVYKYALQRAGVKSSFTSPLSNPAMMICPTAFPEATLYVISSLTDQSELSFRDERSGHQFTGKLEPGRSALLLVKTDGELAASYNWH